MMARSRADTALVRVWREHGCDASTAVMALANEGWWRIRETIGSFTRELVRLNHAGVSPALMRNRTRRERARLVKAALLESYQTHHRCC
jgi:hypothetical protein